MVQKFMISVPGALTDGVYSKAILILLAQGLKTYRWCELALSIPPIIRQTLMPILLEFFPSS
jgi:hypothetical protein